MAGQTLPEPISDSNSDLLVQPTKDMVQQTAARLYGAGMERAKIARVMVNILVPNGKDRPLEQRLSQARTKLRNWEASQAFRDLVYESATIKLDMATPSIFKALVKAGQKGNVNASRLILELTGRHNPKGDTQPTQVIVAINGMPRPSSTPAEMVRADADLTIAEDGTTVVEA